MTRGSLLWTMPAALAALATAGFAQRSPAPATAEAWAITASIAESCSCSSPCPRLLGSPPTYAWCEGSRLVQIEKGHFGGVHLDGLSVVVTFRVREWAKYYVSYPASDAQLLAAEELISHAFPAFASYGVRGTERTPLTITRTPTRLKFAAPFFSIDMEMMKGREGKPIEIRNLPAEFLRGYTQYLSVENSHHDATHGFKYQGTNAFTSRLDTRR
jgi:hypothetical protein